MLLVAVSRELQTVTETHRELVVLNLTVLGSKKAGSHGMCRDFAILVHQVAERPVVTAMNHVSHAPYIWPKFGNGKHHASAYCGCR